MADFWTHRPIKSTRKPHECEQCGRRIDVGSPAIYSVGVFYGDFYRHHEHVECHAAGLEYAKMTDCWGEDFMWFQHNLEERDDKMWLLEHHPIVAERLGLTDWLAEQQEDAA